MEQKQRQEIINRLTDVLEEQFPKHKCKERGNAMVLLAEFNLELRNL